MITSKEYAAQLREKILDPKNAEVMSLLKEHAGEADETTAQVVYDKESNTTSLIHTLGKSSGIVTLGLRFMYSYHMHSFDPVPSRQESVAPRKTPRTGGLGTGVFKNCEPYIALSTPGGRASAEIQAILNIIEFGMHPQWAISVPRLNIFRSRARTVQKVCVKSNFPRPYPVENLEELLGMKCRVDDYTGRLSAIVVDLNTRRVEGGADPRGGGGLALYM